MYFFARFLVFSAILLTSQTAVVAQENEVPPSTEDPSAVAQEIRDLREEISQLRQAIERLTESIAAIEEGPPSRAQSDKTSGRIPPVLGAPPKTGARDDEPLTYTIVKEWGRTPEEAERFGGQVSSLKGMILAVPEWATDAQLTGLGRRLRTSFGHFENINIEVFKDLKSAAAYAESKPPDPDDRVMSISKHAASGRDVALLIRGETVTEIPYSSRSTGAENAAATPAQPNEENP